MSKNTRLWRQQGNKKLECSDNKFFERRYDLKTFRHYLKEVIHLLPYLLTEVVYNARKKIVEEVLGRYQISSEKFWVVSKKNFYMGYVSYSKTSLSKGKIKKILHTRICSSVVELQWKLKDSNKGGFDSQLCQIKVNWCKVAFHFVQTNME